MVEPQPVMKKLEQPPKAMLIATQKTVVSQKPHNMDMNQIFQGLHNNTGQ